MAWRCPGPGLPQAACLKPRALPTCRRSALMLQVRYLARYCLGYLTRPNFYFIEIRREVPRRRIRQDLCPECSKVSQKLEIVVLNTDDTISDRGRRRAEKRLIEAQEREKKKREEEEAMFDDPDFWAAVEYSAQGQRTTQYRGLWYIKDDYGRWQPYDSSSSYASYDSGGYYPSSRGAGASRGATAPSSSLRPPSGSSATSSHRSASSASSSQRPKLSSGSSVSSSQTTSSRSGTVKTASSQSGARDHRSGQK